MNEAPAPRRALPERAPLTSSRWDPLTTDPVDIGDTVYAVAGTEFGKLIVIDQRTRLAVARFHVHNAPVSALDLAPTRDCVASVSRDGRLILNDVVFLTDGGAPTLVQRHCLRAGHAMCHVLFTPDGDRVITGQFCGALGVWDSRTGEQLWSRPNTGLPEAISPCGTRVRLWDGAELDLVTGAITV